MERLSFLGKTSTSLGLRSLVFLTWTSFFVGQDRRYDRVYAVRLDDEI